MAKYDPLRRYLTRQKTDRVELSFSDIEHLIGAYLPKAAARAGWWAGDGADRPANVQVQAWRAAGYEAKLARGGEKVVFQRA